MVTEESKMKYFGGCDSGSTYTKCVIIDENGKMVANITLRSRINSVLSAEDALNQAIEQVSDLHSPKDLTYLVGTGYGRNKVPFEIAAGIEFSVAKRCFVMAKKAGAVDNVTLTGGCAKNEGLKEAIEKVLHLKVVNLPIDPQLMGALGAAEFARQKGLAK